MEQHESTDIGEFREQIRQFLRDNLPADMAYRGQNGFLSSREDALGWQKILAMKGWSVPHWPVEYGGPGWSAVERYVFDEECYLAGAPLVNTGGVALLAPVIYTFGSEEQKQRFLPDIREGNVFWVQGFSEPGAGSDLASLRTTAVRDGDDYIINGQKIWTSFALYGDWNFVLVRTDPAAKKQAGISFILLDLKTPGVTIRPIETLEGSHHLAEVFYDNVRVPAKNLVGEENKGWDYTKFLLFSERTFYGAEAPALKRYLSKAKRYAMQQSLNGRPLIEEPVFASRLAELEIEVMALDTSVNRVIAHGTFDRNGGSAIGSILKVRGTELHQKLCDLLVDIIGDYGAYFYPDSNEKPEYRALLHPGPSYAPGLTGELLYRRASSIYGGANEVQRNIISKSLFRF
ncbi:pimeloyl-CoA dehydrogenase large subunit protein (plasmid) [Rhizobium gallicum]|uniref:Pimeloyl-CoA dehydrogenase large subunit protein n=1 Tax=Rhizobium gallicum TaxID=56730 RepID=A0A1L5NS88_9HYPH|nr:acyl-CoA dehydrogenase family protein [Rhizobium gallicum]APO70709.1 pimeloyl-CoA dehydrogenase large subunit protein [Rhizobium gallicum]